MLPQSLILTRNKANLYIRKTGESRPGIKYSLKEWQMYKRKNGQWQPVKRAYSYFRGYGVSSIVTEEKKFLEMIRLTKQWNSRCSSVSTFLQRMKQVLVIEQYIDEGVKYEVSRYGDYSSRKYRTLNHQLSEYNRNIINIFKKYELEVSINFERTYFQTPNSCEAVMQSVEDNQELEIEEKAKFFKKITSSSGRDFSNFMELVNDFNYEPTALVGYVFNYLKPFENLGFKDAVSDLKDYYEMASQMGRDVKKYPKYLRSMHDIILANYKTFKREYDIDEFSLVIKKGLEYENEKDGFAIVNPSSPNDIVEEGTSLNHCVSSYVDRILKKKTYIFFLRRADMKSIPRVTLEMKDGMIVQAKGSYNRKLEADEREFLAKYARKKGLEVNPRLVNEY